MVNSDFRPKKCFNNEQQAVDRISQLPSEILVYILSFVPVLYAARTSVLSKRWIGLWMYITRLDFDAMRMWEMGAKKTGRIIVSTPIRRNYVESVNKILLSHKEIDLDVFRIRFDLDNSLKHDINKWLQYALAARKLHRLDLNLSGFQYIHFRGSKSYAFPPDLLLSLSDGNSSTVSPSGSDTAFGFQSIRDLRFNSVAVSGSVLEFFLHNCPFLEHLEVVNSESLEKLTVCGPSLVLKYLEVVYCCKLSSLTVLDTNIVSLKFDDGEHLELDNAPKLVEAYIGIPTCIGNLVDSVISKLSCCLSKLEVLTLQIHSLQAYREGEEVALPELTRLKQLTFVMHAPGDVCLIPFTCLIRFSPNLEKFVLKSERILELGSSSDWHYGPRVTDAFRHQNIKVVEIRGYCGHKRREDGLVKYFVQNCVALERIVIDPRNQPFHSYLPVGAPEHEIPKEETMFRDVANKQVRALVPRHVKLVVL